MILVETPEGFIAELTYGEDVNWYRNIVAADGCIVVHKRREYRVNRIERYDANRALSAYPAPFRVVLKTTRRHEFRLLRTDGAPTASR